MITKITKQEFKRELVTHKSYFAGVLNSILEDQILSAYYKFGNTSIVKLKNSIRGARVYSDGLKFTDDSVLSISGSDRTCYKINNNIYILVHEWFDNYDKVTRCKVMVYFTIG